MPRYAPLPAVSIDPRNEASLAQRAAQVVYEASNQTLNDFSAGNPLAALLEGQAFAQGEFLFWANQLPEKILLEWIGPFLGAMRRLGTPATARILVSIAPQNTSTTIPSGSIFTTNAQLTGGESFEFISYEDIVIPAGETLGAVPVYSKFVGSAYNVPENSIVASSTLNSSQLTVTNPAPAVGGSDVETYREVQERFFTLIRRRNPVSETDWQDFFTDLFGDGTLTSVQPNRSSRYAYNYETDYALPNGQVSFFVLGPNGVELTTDQIKSGQNAINFSVPVENQGHLFPITLSQVQYNLTLEVDPNGNFGRNFKQSSLDFRNRLFSVLQPGQTFPATVNPTVSDIDAAFYSSFGIDTRFIDPHISGSVAYNTPNGLSETAATYTQVYNFTPSNYLLSQNDLVRQDTPNPSFYPVVSNFTPYSSDKFDQTIYGNLALKQIKVLSSGAYSSGDIVYYDGSLDPAEQGLHVILEDINIGSAESVISFLSSGKISPVKTYSPWVIGNTYQSGDIVEYDYTPGQFIPAYPSNIPLPERPGALAWVVASNFTLNSSTNDVSGALAASNLGSPITPQSLQPGSTYLAGTWVFTPQVGSGPNESIDPNFFYVDITKGAIVKYAYVVSTFTYLPGSDTVSTYFDSLVSQDVLQEIQVFDGNEGLPICKYKPRFKSGQYLEFREQTNSTPGYFIAAQYFTPPNTNIGEMVSSGLVINLAPTAELYSQFSQELGKGFSGQIGKLKLTFGGGGYVSGNYTNVPLSGGDGTGATADVIVTSGVVSFVQINLKGSNYRVQDMLTIDSSYLGGIGTGLLLSVLSIEPPATDPVNVPVRMFAFFKGDKTFFRNGSRTQSYTATSSVSPLFDFEVYYNNGIFVETVYDANLEGEEIPYIPYFNPEYSLYSENTVLSADGRNFYRVMRAFTPAETVTSWSGTLQSNSARYEEYAGTLLRFVSAYSCEEPVLPQFGKETSSVKLGNCQITIIPKSSLSSNNKNQKLVYVWENTSSLSQTPDLSWYTGTTFPYNPPDYSDGTLAL